MNKENEQLAEHNCNIATIVNIVAIVILMKSNESYCNIMLSIPKNSAIEISKNENIHESKIESNNTARCVDQMTSSQMSYITPKNNHFVVKNEINRSLRRLKNISEINSAIKMTSRKKWHSTIRINIDKISMTCLQSSITDQNINKTLLNSLQNNLTNTLSEYSLRYSNKFPTTIMKRRKTNDRILSKINNSVNKEFYQQSSRDSKLEFNTFLTHLNKKSIINATVYDSVLFNNLNRSKLPLKIHSPKYQILRKKYATAENSSEKFYLKTKSGITLESNYFGVEKGKSDGVLQTNVLAMKTFKYELMSQNSLTMNGEKKVALTHKLGKNAYNLPERRFINKTLNEEIQNKWQKGIVSFNVKLPGGLNNNIKRTKIINKRMIVTSINKLLRRAMHINTRRAKLIKAGQQMSSPIADEQLLGFRYMNDNFILTTEIPALNQLPTKITNDLHTNNRLVPISKYSLQCVSDLEQNSSVNILLENSDKIILKSKISKNTGQTTDTASHEINEVFKTQSIKDLTIKYELNAQTVSQIEYLPSFNDMENSNSNISLRRMPHASSTPLNRNKITKSKKIVSNKIIGISGKQSKATKFHKKTKTIENTTRESIRKTMYRKTQSMKVSTESLKQMQVKKKQSTKVTAEKTLKQKMNKKLKLTSVAHKKYKLPIHNKKVSPTLLSVIKLLTHKQRMKTKLTSAFVKEIKISKKNLKITTTEVSLIESFMLTQEKKMQPTKVTAKKSLQQKKLKQSKTEPIKNKTLETFKGLKHNKKTNKHFRTLRTVSNKIQFKKFKSQSKKSSAVNIKSIIKTLTSSERKKTMTSSKRKKSTKKSMTSDERKKSSKKTMTSDKRKKSSKKTVTSDKRKKSSKKTMTSDKRKKSSKKTVTSYKRKKSSKKTMTNDERKKSAKKTKKIEINSESSFKKKMNRLNTKFVLCNRTRELELRLLGYDKRPKKKKKKPGVEPDRYVVVDVSFNSYNKHRSHHNNQYVFASSGMTDLNNVNNLVIVHYDSTPKYATWPRSSQTPDCLPPTKSTPCPSGLWRTVTFLKRTGIMDINIIMTSIFMGAVMLVIICCCCCAPVIVIRKKPKTIT